MSGADELSRLRQQADDAQVRLDSLLRQREDAQEGRGLAPKPEEIDKARDRLEAAEALLRAHERMAARA
ncbi:hypothetical protein [Mesorhizobium silamurunense]|uniref:hypothetical protein n=1 Tax=Mesorhizobium silamurunense TaxID=499528 RepID=UPI00178328F2|nr:hypothetical protein [Mesorhizobium silamurunense]